MVERTQAPAQPESVTIQQLRVKQHDVGPLALHQLHPVAGADCGADRHEAGLRPQHHGQPGAHCRLGVDDDDPGHDVDPFNAP